MYYNYNRYYYPYRYGNPYLEYATLSLINQINNRPNMALLSSAYTNGHHGYYHGYHHGHDGYHGYNNGHHHGRYCCCHSCRYRR